MVDQAEIHRMASSEDVEKCKVVIDQLRINFAILPNKKHGWCDLIQLAHKEDVYVRWRAVYTLGSVFRHMIEREQAWDDLLHLTTEKESDVWFIAAMSLGAAFLYVPDKKKAWNDLHRLSEDYDSHLRCISVIALNDAFPNVPEINKAWDDLHRLTEDKDLDVRHLTSISLGSTFPHIPNKTQALTDLHRLKGDQCFHVHIRNIKPASFSASVRHTALEVVGAAFLYISDKQPLWAQLHQFTNDEDLYVRWRAASVIGDVFSYISTNEKEQAWDDLIRLTLDVDYVRMNATLSIGKAFPYIIDKKQALNDLQQLANSKDCLLQTCAHYSLGRAAIFRATEAESEEDFRKELIKAIESFEISSIEVPFFNPAIFCLPFYKSFYSITFNKQNAMAEIQRYLKEAKAGVRGSKSKEKSLEAIENLADALKKVYMAQELGFENMEFDLSAYKHCREHTTDNLEEIAPVATKLIRKGLPIIDRTIKELLSELKTKSKEVCIETKDKPQNKIAAELYSEIKKLDAENPVKFDYYIDILIESLKMKIPNVKGNEYILENIEALRLLPDSDYKSLISKLIPIIGAIPQVVIERDQINVKEFKGNLNTGNIVESPAKK